MRSKDIMGSLEERIELPMLQAAADVSASSDDDDDVGSIKSAINKV